jgi:2-hydroxychromene-2-carboxylate isomerase
MTIRADLDIAPLTVVLDIRNPLAYLGLAPAIALGRERELAINWLPIAAMPLRSPTRPGPNDDRGVRHRRHRANMIAREIAIYAEAQGLVINEPYRSAPADGANLAWLWMRAHAPASLETFLVEIFRRYWALELDASDPREAARVIASLGEDDAGFMQWAGSEGSGAFEGIPAELAAAGIAGAPTYWTCDQVFVGRQHLPMIRWLLDGKEGAAPI